MKFKYKMTFCMLGLLSVIFGAGGSMLIATSFKISIEHEKENAYNAFKTVANSIVLMGKYTQYDGIIDIAEIMKQFSEQHLSNWAAAKITSSNGLEYEDGPVKLKDMSKSANSTSCSVSLIESENGRKYLQYSGFITYYQEAVLLDIAYDISSVYEMRDVQKSTYRKIFIIMIIICAVLSYFLSAYLTRPIAALSTATREIASGNLSFRSNIKTNDEIGIVASDFNHMARQLENNINELKLAMEQQENFMGSFAHEMKTPMTSIIGYADLMRSGMLDANEQAEAANFIFSEGKRLENLSFKLLDMLVMNKGSIKLVPVCPGQLIMNLAENLKPVYLSKNIFLQYKCSAGFCMMEPDLIKTLLVNLIDNSRKALEHGGNIFITCEMTAFGCIIRVIDNGRGIPQESLRHLTEAFYRVDKSRSRAQGGVGLGLSLCNEITKLHNGTISFDSREGNGTCVTVELKGGRA